MQVELNDIIEKLKDYEGSDFLVNDALIRFLQENDIHHDTGKWGKDLLIVLTSRGRVIIKVRDTKKNTCIEALAHFLKVSIDDITQISSDKSGSVYGLRQKINSAAEWFTPTVFFSTNEYPLYFVVQYAITNTFAEGQNEIG